MPPGVCSKLIMYWHRSLLQTKANQPIPMLKAMWALSIHKKASVILASSTALCPRALFFPQHNLESHIIYLLWEILFPTKISYSSQQVGTKAERRNSQGHREGCEGWNSSLAPAYQCRAVWGDILHRRTFRYYFQGWDCTMTRARHLFVTSPLQVLTSKNCSAGNNNSFTEPMVLWTPAHHLFFHSLAF